MPLKKDIIISVSYDQSIKIQDCAKQSTFIEYNTIKSLIKFILDTINNNILLCSNFECFLWIFKIGYKNKSQSNNIKMRMNN